MTDGKTVSYDFSFKIAVRRVLKEAAEEYNKSKEFTEPILLKLRYTFGPTFERALELFEGNKVTAYKLESTRNTDTERADCCFYEVQGHSTEVYTIFSSVNYCPCLAFEINVLKNQESFTCKHVLAVWLATVSNSHLNVQILPESKYCEILLGRVTEN